MSIVRYPRTLLGTCCIPWKEDGTLAEEIFRRSITHLLHNGFDNLYLFGTAGEGYAVTDSQFDDIVKIFVDELTAKAATPMVGVINLSLPTVIQRIERALEMGVRDFQISLPSWGALSDNELKTFFRETCGRFEGCRFLHYNLLRAGRLITPGEYSVLAEEHPNLVATKNSTSDLDRVRGLLQGSPQLRHFLTETGYAYGSLIGEPGFLVSVASCHPRRARDFFEAGVRRDTAFLLAMQGELDALLQELLGTVEAGPHMDGAFDKIFIRLLQPNFPLRLLPPYESVPEEAFLRFRDVLRQKFPRWLAQ